MSDAKNRLQEALNKAKSKKVPKAPVVSERKTSPPKRQSSPPAPKKIEAPKPKAKKKTPKSKKSAGSNSALFKNIQNFASTVIDELKTATSEIAPSALFATANDGIKSLRKAVSFEKGDAPAPTSESAPQVSESASPEPAPSAAPPPNAPAPSPAPQQNQPPQYTSPAKVQRIASKKKTAEEQPAPSAQAESASLPDPPAPSEPSATAPKAFTSPAKVQRIASMKKTTEDAEPPIQTESAFQDTPPRGATHEERVLTQFYVVKS